MYTDNFFFALTLTALAGLSTGIGSIIVFFTRHLNSRMLACSLGISAGVMIYVSFMEMMPEAIATLTPSHGEKMAEVMVVILFFVGIGLVAVIDRLVPKWQNPHEIGNAKLLESPDILADKKLLRLGIFSAVVIALHNFPEGMATFMSALKNPEVGIGVALAIAIHNIPEGIAVAAPIYFATRKRSSALLLSFGSGLAEILGALVWYYLIMQIFGEVNFGYIFAVVAGIMVYISLDELLPTAEEYGEHHIAIAGLVMGMGIMAVSLLLLW